MTVEIDIAKLTAATTALTETVNVQKSVLDTSVRTATAQAVIAKAAADAVGTNLGYQIAVAYVAGLSITLANQVVSFVGPDGKSNSYAPVSPAVLPFTTSGTFEAAKFRLVAGVMAGDLAAPGGSATVGFPAVGVGAFPCTVEFMLRQRVNVLQFIPASYHASIKAGTNSFPLHGYIQFAINEVCGVNGHLHFSSGGYTLAAPLTFPSKSFILSGEGPTATSISELGGSGQIKLFDLSNINGPSVLVDNIGFFGPKSGGLGGTGCYISNSNGVAIRNCWYGGLLVGNNKTNTASFLRVLDCTYEFVYNAVILNDAVQCMVSNSTYYNCSYDLLLTGDCNASLITNATHIETKISALTLDGAKWATINNVTFRQDFYQALPKLILLENNASDNTVTGIYNKNFGSTLIELASNSFCSNNKFSKIYSALLAVVAPSQPPPTGTSAAGIVVGVTCSGNTFDDFTLRGCGYGIIDAAGNNDYSHGKIYQSATAGVSLRAASDCKFLDIQFANNAADWDVTSTTQTVWLDEIRSNMSGFNPGRFGKLGVGIYGRTFYKAYSPPTAFEHLVGDHYINFIPTPGSPKGWICTVAGTPGTFVAEGNL